MRRLLVSLTILAVLFFGIDYLAKDYVAGRIEGQLQRSFDTDRGPEVDIEAFPFLLAALNGRVATLEVRAVRITVERVSFVEVLIVLDGVRFSTGDLLSGKADAVSAQSGHGHASLTGPALEQIVARESPDVDVQVRGDNVTLSTPDTPGPVTAEVTLQGNALVLAPDGGLDTIVIPLPEIASGLTYRDVEVEDSAVKLEFELKRPRLDLEL